mmetsp:Transcript_24832/g.58264  ORF Transcript_24832/g.58264 Transcript_24832/m.58264 type:complete len:98 (+) Transcript_24832:119-412(+)
MQPHIPLTDEEIECIWAAAQKFSASPRYSIPPGEASSKHSTQPRADSISSAFLSTLRGGALAILGSGQNSGVAKTNCNHRVPKDLRKTHDPYLPHIV